MKTVPHHSPLAILYRDERLIAIAKPAGLLVHRSPLDAASTPSAARMLREQLGQSVHAAHRLDKGTSGVLLFALDADMARTLANAFEAGRVSKTYHAIVRGWPSSEGRIDHPLRREDEDSHRTARREQVQDALTHYRCLQRFNLPIADSRPDGSSFESTRLAVVELQPLTGRRHQLRRHMKHIAHPIVGDATHGKGPLNRAVAALLGMQRLWLHASKLELDASDGSGKLCIECPHGFEAMLYHGAPQN
jgi:tRNA pseudouridine65 synthase